MKTTFTVYDVSYSWCDDIDRWFASEAEAVDHANSEISEKVADRQKFDWQCHRHTDVEAGRYTSSVVAWAFTVELEERSDDFGGIEYWFVNGDSERKIDVDDVLDLASVADELGLTEEMPGCVARTVKTLRNEQA